MWEACRLTWQCQSKLFAYECSFIFFLVFWFFMLSFNWFAFIIVYIMVIMANFNLLYGPLGGLLSSCDEHSKMLYFGMHTFAIQLVINCMYIFLTSSFFSYWFFVLCVCVSHQKNHATFYTQINAINYTIYSITQNILFVHAHVHRYIFILILNAWKS